MATAVGTSNLKYVWLSPVHVSTTIKVVYVDPGMKGVIYPLAGDKAGIQTYRSMLQVEQDYDIDSDIWNQANAYFGKALDGQFQVLTYDQNYTAPATTPNTSTTTDSGSVTVTDAAGSGTPSATDGLIQALYHYYGAGFEHILLTADETSKDLVFAVSNFVEAQDKGYVTVSTTTPEGETPDFSWLEQIKDNRATAVKSLPANLDPNNTFGAEQLGAYVERALGANGKSIQDLQTVTPQDQYEFGYVDLAPYRKYNVATYAYENKVAMTTSGRSLSGVSTSIMMVRDALVNTIVERVSDFLVQNDVTPYDQSSVDMIIAIIQGVLKEFQSKSLIESSTVSPVDVTSIPDTVKATGDLNGVTWTFKPMRSIDDAWFAQTLELTENE